MNEPLRLLVPGTFLLLAAFQLPAPSGPVNDFAGVLPEAREAALEARLGAYERERGTAIVVATVPDLGGRAVEEYANTLFNRWGVGAEGTDRGVLVLVAPNDRRARIEVGYGLEARLPDSVSRRIMDDQLVPRLRQGDFAGGIEAAVDALLAVLARPGPPLTAERLPDDPATVRTAEQLHRPVAPAGGTRGSGDGAPSAPEPLVHPGAEEAGGGGRVAPLLALAAALAGTVWGVARVRERRRRDALRKRLREHEVPARAAAVDEARRMLEERCRTAAGLLPLAADQATIARAGAVIEAGVRHDEEEIAAARALIDGDPDAAAELLERAEGRDRILALWREIGKRIEAYGAAARDAPAVVARGADLLARSGAACEAAEREGYRTPDDALREAGAGLDQARALLAGAPADPEAAVRAARAAAELLERTASRVAALPEARRRAAEALARVRDEHARVTEHAGAANGTLELLRAGYPPPVWEAVAREADGLPGVLEAAAGRLEEAERAGGMEVQDFALAQRIVREVEPTLAQAAATAAAPSAVLAAQEEAALECPGERDRAEAALRDATRACRHGDVRSRTRTRLREVAAALEGIGPAEGTVDYVKLRESLRRTAAAALAVATAAREDVREAEEDRRRRDERDDERRSRERTSTPSRSGDGGGGGFGGGRSGGAGASGSW